MKATQKYAVISRFAKRYPVSMMCKFFSVSRSGYYRWRKTDQSIDKDKAIGELNRQCQKQTHTTYGYRRVKLWLLRETGLIINHKAVLRIMNKYNLLAQIRRPRLYHQKHDQFKKYENKLKRDF